MHRWLWCVAYALVTSSVRETATEAELNIKLFFKHHFIAVHFLWTIPHLHEMKVGKTWWIIANHSVKCCIRIIVPVFNNLLNWYKHTSICLFRLKNTKFHVMHCNVFFVNQQMFPNLFNFRNVWNPHRSNATDILWNSQHYKTYLRLPYNENKRKWLPDYLLHLYLH